MIYSIRDEDLVDLIRIFVADPDYEVRPDHIRDQLKKVRERRQEPEGIADPERRETFHGR